MLVTVFRNRSPRCAWWRSLVFLGIALLIDYLKINVISVIIKRKNTKSTDTSQYYSVLKREFLHMLQYG